MLTFTIKKSSWLADEPLLRAVRQVVFVEEQAVPLALEWDGLDADAQHLLAHDCHGAPIGCARILSNGSIGRMAVLPDWRKHGVGMALLEAAIHLCRQQGWQEANLSAQTHAIGFYERAGFKVCSETYLDAGIPHRDMKLDLST